jgi:hypothetical protein
MTTPSTLGLAVHETAISRAARRVARWPQKWRIPAYNALPGNDGECHCVVTGLHNSINFS